MKKILAIGMTTFPGGIERYLVNWFQSMDKTQYQIEFLNQETDEQIAYSDYIKEHGGNIVKAVKRKGHFWRHYWELMKLYSKHYDIIYYNTLDLGNVDFLIMAKLFDRDTIKIIHAHSSNSFSKGIRALLIKIHTKYINKISDIRLACSNVAGDWMFKNFDYKVIHNAIDLNKFTFRLNDKEKMLQKLELKDKKIWGTVGRLVMVKNPLFIIEIMKCVHEINKEVVFLHIGDGPMKQLMYDKIKEYGLEKVYFLLGERKNVEDYYQVIDKVIFPSLYEGLAITLIEAQSMGIKCFVSDKVPMECDMNIGLFTSLSLSLEARKWAEIIIESEEIADEQRTGCFQHVKQRGYDLNDFAFMDEIMR